MSKTSAQLIKEKRLEAEMSQYTLASKCKLQQKDISRWENGHTKPGIESLQKLAKALKCNWKDLA